MDKLHKFLSYLTTPQIVKRVYIFAVFIAIGFTLPIHLYAVKEESLDYLKQEIKRADSLYIRQQYLAALDAYISQLGYAHRNKADSLYLLLLSRIGTIYDNYEDSGRAFYYYEKVLSDPNAEKYGDLVSTMLIKMVVGYYNGKEPDNARRYYNLQLSHPIKDKVLNKYYLYTNGGLVNRIEGNHKQAVTFFREALKHCAESGLSPEHRVAVMIELADSYSDLGKSDSVRYYLNEALNISKSGDFVSYAADCYKRLYKLSKQSGDSSEAARYLELYSTATDSVDHLRKLDVASLRLLQSHDAQAREEINYLNERIDFQTKMLILFILFCVTLAVFVVYVRLQHRRLKTSYRLLIEKNDEIFELEDKSTVPTSSETDTPELLVNNPLLEKIDAVFNDINLISQPSFSLAELSREVGSNTKYVSSLINTVYKKNFRTLLNERRIREATRRLSDSQHYGDQSIADIADSLGYSSATVFINAFKKVIGMTPAVYRRYRK